VGQQALGCKHLALGLPCTTTESFKSCRGWDCAPGCRHLAMGLHALSARTRPAHLAADPGERVCRTACLGLQTRLLGSAESCAWVWRPQRWVQTITFRVCRPAPLGPNPLVIDLRLMDPTSRPNSLGSDIRTKG